MLIITIIAIFLLYGWALEQLLIDGHDDEEDEIYAICYR